MKSSRQFSVLCFLELMTHSVVCVPVLLHKFTGAGMQECWVLQQQSVESLGSAVEASIGFGATLPLPNVAKQEQCVPVTGMQAQN